MEKYPECKVIAEVGCTHAGSMERAKELIRLAKLAGAHVVKFQKRCPEESVPKKWWDKPHPNKLFAYGDTYLEHRKNLELTFLQHAELKQYCEDIGIEYSSSVWDMTSACEIISLQPKMIKIPSACNHRFDIINYLFDRYEGEIHISLGMTTLEERIKLINCVFGDTRDKGTLIDAQRTVLYHCTSGYPVPFEQLYLQEIAWLESTAPCQYINGEGKFQVGFSGHGFGIAADIAAYTLGATWIERHFVDDRTFPHTDAAASLEPDGLRRLCRDLKAIRLALQSKPDDLIGLEQEQRDKLRS